MTKATTEDDLIQKHSFAQSDILFARAKKAIPAQCHTLSNGTTQYVTNVSPKFLKRGDGCHVWDVDNNKYLDLGPGGFPAILGYNNKDFIGAVTSQLADGLLFPMPTQIEVETAEKVIGCIPCAERVRFAKNGSDVTALAVRLSRAVTGRDKIAAGGYHGYHDWYIGTTGRIKGIPKAVRDLTLTFEYNNLASLEELFAENPDEIAAVIMEPVQLSAPQDDFLNKAKDLAHKNGALLIFDEIITGFRFALGGAQEYFGVTPDLATFGKAMGNSMPVSALVGRADLMDNFTFDGVFFSSTFGGECGSLAAVGATIDLIKKHHVIDHVWRIGDKIHDGFNELTKQVGIDKHLRCTGFAPWTNIDADSAGLNITDLELKSLFQQECMKRGLLAGLFHAPCLAHTDEDVALGLRIYESAMLQLKEHIADDNPAKFLEGRPIMPVFRQKK